MVILARLATLAAALSAVALLSAQMKEPFTVVEAGIADLQGAMTEGRVTSKQIVEEYLARIDRYDSTLRAAMTMNPRALDEADALDRERAAGRIRGPLHGIPIAVKDNIHTTDMPTTAGALAFQGFVPPYEATLVRNLRAAGAIIIAKTALTELANWMAGLPTPMPTGYNAIRGFSFNPFDPRPDPNPQLGGRPVLPPGGSSSGIGTSANLWTASVGTETSGSILNPANQTMLAAIKPTVGRVSRYGVVPVTADQDTPGPMTKSVRDAAILLGVLGSGGPDAHDPATRACPAPPRDDYTAFLREDALKGARIGIPRVFYYEPLILPNGQRAGGLGVNESRVMAEAIGVLRELGAVIVDPVEIPSIVSRTPDDNFLMWGICSGALGGRGGDDQCSIVLKYGMKRDFNRWLESLGSKAPVPSLTALREWNIANRERGTLRFGQSTLDISDDMDPDRDRARYEADRAKDVRLAATQGIDAALESGNLDALLFPADFGSALAARPGYPTVMVPFGLIRNARVPVENAEFNPGPQPFSVSFTGTACSEPRLLALAYAFEQATRRRVSPAATP